MAVIAERITEPDSEFLAPMMQTWRIGVVTAALLAVTGCSFVVVGPVSLQIPRGNGCRVVRLPRGAHWIAEDPNTSLPPNRQFRIGYSSYEMRRPTDPDQTILIGTEIWVGRGSTNHFSLNLNEGTVLTPITEQEWRNGRPIKAFGRSTVERPPDFRLREIPSPTRPGKLAVEIAGRVFDTEGGQFLFPAIKLQPRWVAVVRYKDRRTSDALWVELFRGSDGKKLLTMEGDAGGTPGSEVEGNGVWILDRYFILPMGTFMDKFMLCDLEQVNAMAK